MSSVALTGADVAVISGRVLNDVADGDWAMLEFENDIANMKVSKDLNSIYALNNTGFLVKFTARILLNSSDDQFLNGLLQQMLNDLSAFTLLSGSFTKRAGDGSGNVTSKIYQVNGGIFKKIPAAKSSAEGDVAQSVAVYEMLFRNTARSIS